MLDRILIMKGLKIFAPIVITAAAVYAAANHPETYASFCEGRV
jgi:hypothetical protein